MELSKKDKKTAREIIELGLLKEFENGLMKADKIITNWKSEQKNNREAYHSLFDHIHKFDKHIALRYDGMTGSRYLLIIAGQLNEGIISDADLENFSEEAKQTVKRIADI
ncbi:MAG: hypothetical protein PF541_14365 [Prolixibacteraceae bacterium]|jgi:hypothetical protein|nr:hypothetical protein [Prolixibacteraceae bacterium]